MVTGGDRGEAPVVREIDQAPRVGCGGAVAGHRVCIVDPDARTTVAPGVPGEVWVSGPSVAKGYWKNEDATRRTFRNHLSTGDVGVAYLATGDLGRIVDGQLFVTGRSKDLIIIRGQNHHPQDIERTVELAVPEIGRSATAAFAVESEATEGLVLVCEVERTRRHDLDADDVLRRIRRVLSEDHELAAQAVVLVRPGSVPRTTSGKIQRSACREAFRQGILETIAVSDVASVSTELADSSASVEIDRRSLGTMEPSERRQEIEAYLLGRIAAMRPGTDEGVRADEPLSAAGFDSLSLAELLARAQADLEVDLGLETLGADSTVRDVAVELARQVESEPLSAPAPAPAPRTPTSRELPMTPAQHDLLSPQYENPAGFVTEVLLRVPAGVDADELEAAVRDAAARHDALRMTFVPGPDGYRQIERGDGAAVDWRYESARGFDADAIRNLSARLTQEATSTMDLAAGPLLRATYIDRGPVSTGILRLDVHHLVVDRISLMVLFSDLEAAWKRRGQRETGGSSRAPAVTYRRWVEALVERASSAEVESELDYWIETCRGIEDVKAGGSGARNVSTVALEEEPSARLRVTRQLRRSTICFSRRSAGRGRGIPGSVRSWSISKDTDAIRSVMSRRRCAPSDGCRTTTRCACGSIGRTTMHCRSRWRLGRGLASRITGRVSGCSVVSVPTRRSDVDWMLYRVRCWR